MSLIALQKKILHYTGKAINHFNMIAQNDNILVCLSGGKDSWAMVWALKELKARSKVRFNFTVFTLDQGQPGWDDQALKQRLEAMNLNYEVLHRDTYSIVTDKIPENKTYCSLCSRLRRGIVYRYARENGFNKVALGHHRDDLITTLLMSIFYNGAIKSMPPKLLNEDKDLIVIRPLAYVQEKDLIDFAMQMNFPIIPCNLCGSQENLQRQSVKALIHKMAQTNQKIPSNILHALSSLTPSHLMDKNYWDFKNLEREQVNGNITPFCDEQEFIQQEEDIW
ncbi:tRNA 2-thiocytidine(32) synthetase TtcA [bacterium]|jgi:tRNA 2-thiocytidine biosynthesis protein TtcA|nr:tRNA 2-thiocytidine(32) synthetase TtcA [bacterium]NBW56276.1 tRNA 2-thiocytidine(32) synthetase TtcA [bacterium]NBX72378.1 tRNA 2-thiocytidine(32) synthetase TtcA [bacterium]